METARAHILVEGKVQGVYYRVSARKQARSLGLVGWVRNCPDGSVECVTEGERDKIEELAAWCRQGPAKSVVKEVTIKWADYQGEFSAFDIAPDRRK